MAESELELMRQFRPKAHNVAYLHQPAAAATSSEELGPVPTQRFLTLGHWGCLLV